jgi:hypothetical protein
MPKSANKSDVAPNGRLELGSKNVNYLATTDGPQKSETMGGGLLDTYFLNNPLLKGQERQVI